MSPLPQNLVLAPYTLARANGRLRGLKHSLCFPTLVSLSALLILFVLLHMGQIVVMIGYLLELHY